MDSRRQHRISYQAKIRLRAPGRDDSVVARIQNLSPRGVFVTAPEIPAAGTEVQCRLTLAGERRTLRGRVAWVRPASTNAPLRSPGAGIEFLDLEQGDAELLHRLVEPGDAERQPVDVWFEGMTSAIRCQAVVVGEGVRLATRLPFMRLSSTVKVSFAGGLEGKVREGIIDAVMLEPRREDGIPHLQVNVSMSGLTESAEGVIETPYNPRGAAPIPPPTTVVDASLRAPAPVVMTTADADATPRMEKSGPSFLATLATELPGIMRPAVQRTLLWLAHGWRPVGAGFVAGALLVSVASSVLRPSDVPRGPALARVPRATDVDEQRRPRIEPLPAPAAEPPAAVDETPAAAGPPDESEATPAPATDETASPEAARAREAAVALQVRARGVRLELPLLGNTKGAQSYRLAEPPGMAVTLPHGRPRVPAGVYHPSGGPLRVQIRQLAQGQGQSQGKVSQVRFFYDPHVYDGRVLLDSGVVGIDLIKLGKK